MEHTISTSLGERIKRLREFKGFKQATMAKLLKLSVNGYGKIERDESSIRIDRLEQIATVLGVSVAHLIGHNEAEFHDNIINVKSKDNDYRLLELRVKNLEELLMSKGFFTH